MSRAAQGQAGTDPLLKTKDTLEGLADTFLCDDDEGGPLSAIDPVVEDPLHKSTGEIKQAGGHASLSCKALIAVQERDSEIICLSCQALDEKEAAIVPCYYLKKEEILIRKWQPPEAPVSYDWKVVYLVVIPKKHQHDIFSLVHKSLWLVIFEYKENILIGIGSLLLARDMKTCQGFLPYLPHVPDGWETKPKTTSCPIKDNLSLR